ncbi:hypothetical protein [Oceanibacterium hippocampi]|uniref:Uncharacterized protein n=1 Tax=Oceanibacterium hippocampi TaxID=745714 RepID=A0A1Y5SMK4_9PROT|nr:hypothetical protein [Oceanibacterium hippocampi]SLN44180.1 hypothetical protein OCH7691_01856 [Oceanibacterium hippocampi]
MSDTPPDGDVPPRPGPAGFWQAADRLRAAMNTARKQAAEEAQALKAATGKAADAYRSRYLAGFPALDDDPDASGDGDSPDGTDTPEATQPVAATETGKDDTDRPPVEAETDEPASEGADAGQPRPAAPPEPPGPPAPDDGKEPGTPFAALPPLERSILAYFEATIPALRDLARPLPRQG